MKFLPDHKSPNVVADTGRTYEWDASNRLIAINYGGIGSRSEFSYDGLSRRVKIVEKQRPVPAWSVTIQPAGKRIRHV